MGLFGNKDVKNLDRELMALYMALKLGAGASSSPERFAAGVRSAETDAVGQAARACAAGKAGEVAAIVSKMRAKPLDGDAKAKFDRVLDQVQAAS
jgi:hypothetical protein